MGAIFGSSRANSKPYLCLPQKKKNCDHQRGCSPFVYFRMQIQGREDRCDVHKLSDSLARRRPRGGAVKRAPSL
jgi:hypothetical protein